MSGILGQLVIWINSVQIMTLLPMLQVVLPALTVMFLKIIIDISEFDILDPDYTTDLVF